MRTIVILFIYLLNVFLVTGLFYVRFWWNYWTFLQFCFRKLFRTFPRVLFTLPIFQFLLVRRKESDLNVFRCTTFLTKALIFLTTFSSANCSKYPLGCLANTYIRLASCPTEMYHYKAINIYLKNHTPNTGHWPFRKLTLR